MTQQIMEKGKIVTAAGTGINLALGVLYAWSIFKGAIKQSIDAGGADAFNWNIASLNDPYAICCLVFAFTMILAGKFQDMFGPRITAIIGGVLVGAGFIWVSQTKDYYSWILGFGLLAGSGIAFGYSSATPPALKWYPPNKTGKIAGIVVSGFGLASVYIAPLAQYLLGSWGLQKAMLFLGIGFLMCVCLLSLFLINPPEGYVPKGFVDRRANRETRTKFADNSATALEMIKTPTFWMLWLLFFMGAGAGLMVISSVAGIAKKSMGDNAFLAVAIMAVGNAGGRVAAGMLSDKIGRKRTLGSIFLIQAVLMFAAIPITGSASAGALPVVILATLIGFNYGANLSLFPSYTKDLWGMKNFGVNYGILFSAWGVGGFIMSKVSQTLMAGSDSFTASFMAAGILLAAGTLFTLLLKDEKDALRRKIAQGIPAKKVRQ